MAITFGSRRSGSSAAGGSGSKTSSAAPARCFDSSADSRAARSTRLPRATFTRIEPGRIRASSAAPRRGLPFSPAVAWSVTMSDAARSSGRPRSGTPISRARAAGRKGSNATTFASNARARKATREPTCPRPMTPRVFPASSDPTNFDFSHFPCAMEADAAGTCRSSENRRANVCSVADTTLAVGAFRTSTPRAVAAGTSTLSTPTPARPTTESFGAAAKSSASTFVALRTRRASAVASSDRSFSRGAPARSTTSCPAWRRRSNPADATFSATTTRLMKT